MIYVYMPKNSIEQLKQDEEKILEELSKNANKNINEIAKSCGFSRQKVWRIIKKLEENHTIWGYNAITDPNKLNKKAYLLIIKRTNKPTNEAILKKAIDKEFSNKLKKIGIELIDSFYTHGFFDWVIYFYASDIKIAKRFLEFFNKNYEGYVSESYLIEVMFLMTKCGIINPEIEKFINYFKIQ